MSRLLPFRENSLEFLILNLILFFCLLQTKNLVKIGLCWLYEFWGWLLGLINQSLIAYLRIVQIMYIIWQSRFVNHYFGIVQLLSVEISTMNFMLCCDQAPWQRFSNQECHFLSSNLCSLYWYFQQDFDEKSCENKKLRPVALVCNPSKFEACFWW